VAGDLVEDQLSRGWRVTVAAPEGTDLWRRGGAAGASRLAWEATRAPGPALPAELRHLRRIVAAAQPDLVHLHSAKAGLAGRLVLRGRLPTVFQPHAWSFEAARRAMRHAVVAWERSAARWTDVTVCVSQDESARGRSVGIRGSFAVVPNGIDLSAYRPASEEERRAARAALGLGPGPLAVAVGRLWEQKGQMTLLDAWPTVLAQVGDAELALVGDGPDRPLLVARGVAGVRFAGTRADVDRWLAAADVVVIASRWEAGMSLVAMEAMASARSVVATDVAGMRTGLGSEAGAVVPIDDAPSLARAIAPRLADRALADAEGRAGRARVEERHDIRTATARMAGAYAEVMARRGAPSDGPGRP